MDPTDVVAYPVFASKAAMMVEIKRVCLPHIPNYFDLERRIANTDTATFGDGTFDPNVA